MYRPLILSTGLALASIGVGSETLPLAEYAAHRPPKECVSFVMDHFGDDLPAVVGHNIDLAEASELSKQERMKSHAETVKTDTGTSDQLELTNPIHRDDYIRDHIAHWGELLLPRSGIQLRVGSEVEVGFDVEKLENIWEQSYRTDNPDDPFESVVNECIADSVFEEDKLAGQTWTLIIVGSHDEKRLYEELIADTNRTRQDGAVGSSTAGSEIYAVMHSKDSDFILIDTARTIVHEFDHKATQQLGARPFQSKFFEYRARRAEHEASLIMKSAGSFLILN